MGKFKFLAGLTAAALAGVFSVSSASAAPLPCPDDFIADGTAKVYYDPGQLTAARGCSYDTLATGNDSPEGVNNPVNLLSYFGFNDWERVQKTDLPEGAGAAGSWSIPGVVNFAVYDYMLIFKDGAPTSLIGFLLNEEVSLGLWFSPFENPPFAVQGTKDVSHWSMYRREGDFICVDCGQDVPEPGSFSLLLIGLLGLGGLAFAGARRARV